MKTKNLRITKFSISNYAPFYESMGITEFSFDRTTSKNPLVLILGQNGSGKTYLLTELSPEPTEHIAGRISNRYLKDKEGKKVIEYTVSDNNGVDIETFTCSITFSADRRKTVCFLTRKNLLTGEEEELNSNGNVSSYMDQIEKYLGYTKTYKNIGYISENVKNLVKMGFNERQQLISNWLPNTGEFLQASKIAQKKKNQTQKEIDGLLKDIAKISLGDIEKNMKTEEEKLLIKEAKLTKVKDGLSKVSLIRASLARYTKESFVLKKNEFLKDVSLHNERFNKNQEAFTKYSEYLKGEEGKEKLKAKIHELDLERERLLSEERNLNDEILRLTSSIESSSFKENQGTAQGYSLISVNDSISKNDEELSKIDFLIKESLKENEEYLQFNSFSQDIKDSVKASIQALMSVAIITTKIENMCVKEDFKKLYDHSLETSVSEEVTILKKTNESLDAQLKNLNENLAECQNHSVHFQSLKPFIPNSCSEKNCSLIKALFEMASDNDNSEISKIKKEIVRVQNDIELNRKSIEEKQIKIQNLKNALYDMAQVTDTMGPVYQKIEYLPKSLGESLQDTNLANILLNCGRLLEESRHFEDYVSLLEKKESIIKANENLKNISKLLTIGEAEKKRIEEEIETRRKASESLKVNRENLLKVNEEKDKLNRLSENIAALSEEKKAIYENSKSLEKRKELLLKENEFVYNSRSMASCEKNLRDLEFTLGKDVSEIKSKIEAFKVQLTSADTLKNRKEHLEQKKEIYDLTYQIWSSGGYPSLLIKDFLDEVTYSTNKDLDNSWGGLLSVARFKLDDTSLTVPIQRGETELNDVTECSKAEQATINLAISFGIIDVSTQDKMYNIVRTDEIDGGFDAIRRQSFLDQITNRLTEIGCTNVFCVTHSNCFENNQADVILLKGWDSMVSDSSLSNKNIIFCYDKAL